MRAGRDRRRDAIAGITMPLRPINAVLAIGVAALPWPALAALDHFNRGCGDGLCSFSSGLLILGALAAATLVFLRRSDRRGEAPAWLRWVPAVLWIALLIPLVY
ncbi:MAG: hypothetical protein AB7V13_10230 [Pseudorhodoplanes sp.]